MPKIRLDQLLLQKGLAESRTAARAYILTGKVSVNKKIITKAGWPVDQNATITCQAPRKYVSRGGLKLEKAIELFRLSVQDRIILDLGASTGGFTHCLLQHGAAKVYSVDVGKNQLAYSLRTNSKVISMEGLHVKELRRELFDPFPELVVIDLSFISLTRVLPYLALLLGKLRILALVKPQFEVGQNVPRFRGVVESPDAHVAALLQVHKAALKNAFFAQALIYSPLKGPKGNIEFFVYWSDVPNRSFVFEQECQCVVAAAHQHVFDA